MSAFDPVRREIARVAITALVQDGRIHPTRIEEAVNKARRDVETTMAEAAEAAAAEAGVLNLHPEVLKVFGRLRFRTSYGQNVMRHCVETAHIAAMMARDSNTSPPGEEIRTFSVLVSPACVMASITDSALTPQSAEITS